MEKKEKKIKWYQIILAIIVSICIYFSMLLGIYSLLNIKKSNAYTNNIVPYENEQITNLTGSTWQFNNTLSYSTSLDITYNINFLVSQYGTEKECISIKFTYTFDYEIIGFEANNWQVIMYQGGWNGPQPEIQTIKITGGNDVTNTNLINLLYQNATLLEIEEPEEFYSINYNLQNVLIIGEKPTEISNQDEINIEIQNFNNYELPQNIMIENASYNWNYETGILTIYNATGNVNITIRAEYISGNYSFIELIDSVILIPLNTFFNLFNFELFGVNIYALLTATLTLFVIIKILLKVFK